MRKVLNLIINGLPSIHGGIKMKKERIEKVLNLIINGLPSIRRRNSSKIHN